MPDPKMVLVPATVVTALAQMLQQQPVVALYLALMACKEAPEPSTNGADATADVAP